MSARYPFRSPNCLELEVEDLLPTIVTHGEIASIDEPPALVERGELTPTRCLPQRRGPRATAKERFLYPSSGVNHRPLTVRTTNDRQAHG